MLVLEKQGKVYEILLLLVASTSLLSFTGCGGGGGTSQVKHEVTFDIAAADTPIVADQGDTIYFLAAFNSEKGVKAAFWGIRDNEAPRLLTQSYVWGDNPNVGVRTLYSEDTVPYLVFDEATGFSMTLRWIGSECYLKVYDINGLFIGGCILQKTGDSQISARELPDPQVNGTFQTYIDELDAGLLTFTVVGSGSRKRCRDDYSEGTISHTRSTPDPVVVSNYLSAFQQIAEIQNPQAHSVLSIVARDVKKTGTSPLAKQIVDTVAQGRQEIPIHRLILGLVAIQMLNDEASGWKDRLTKDPNVLQNGKIRFVSNDYRAGWYRPREAFIAASAQGDPTRVQGVMFAREFGAINLDGIVDAQRRFILSGRSDSGDIVEVSGEISGDLSQATGSWKWTPSTARLRGRSSGSFNAQRRPLGTCRTQYNSGGQGSYALVYDLGVPCGTFEFSYDTYRIPDRVQIFHDGRLIYDSGVVGTRGVVTESIAYNGSTTFVQVVITAPLDGTLWTYELGCPR